MVVVVNARLDRLPEEHEDKEDLSSHNPTFQPLMHPLETHNHLPNVRVGVLPGPYSTSAFSAYYSL